MTGFTRIAALLAAGALLAQPCAAQELRDSAGGMQRQSSAFAGLNLRLPLGLASRAKPTARLQFTTTHAFRDARTGATQTWKAQGLEIGGGKQGKPALYLNGQSTADLQKRLNANGTGKTLLIVGGVVLVAVVVAAAMAASVAGGSCPAYEGNKDHCID
jgi:hypothetical protein